MSTPPSTLAPHQVAPFPRPRRPGYRLLSVLTLLGCAALVWYFLQATAGAKVPAATLVGRWYGICGALLFLVGALYNVRHQIYRQRIGSLELWYRAHLVFGAVAIAVLGCHSGFAVRSAFLGALQVGFWGTVLTGAVGCAWQTAFKRWLLRNEWRPLVRSEIERERTAILRRLTELSEADLAERGKLMEQAQQRLARLRSGALLRFPAPDFWDAEARRILEEPSFQELNSAEREQLVELNRLEVQRNYHRRLRAWTSVHLLFTVLGVQLVLWHIWMVAVHPR
jgi:hypothetical protein